MKRSGHGLLIILLAVLAALMLLSLCLGRYAVPLREVLRAGDLEETQHRIMQAIREKPKGHCFLQQAAVTEQQKMVQIGG